MTPASSFPEADLTVDGTGLLCETLLLRLREKIGDAPPVPSSMPSPPTRRRHSACLPGAT